MRRGFCFLLISFLSGSPILSQELFVEDFEHGLERWKVHGTDVAAVVEHDGRRALQLKPNGDALVWIPESAEWGGVRVEGELLVPSEENSYLGIAYNIVRRGDRFDFGLIYLKGNDSYLQVNPHRDFNVSRTLYPEFRVNLEDSNGEPRVRMGEWVEFAIEVIAETAHVFVGDLEEPALVFCDLELSDGMFGFQPRSVGGPVLVDDIVVRSIEEFSRPGCVTPALLDSRFRPALPLSEWKVAGPFPATRDEIARDPETYSGWRTFRPDSRGAIVTGSVVDFHGPDTVAYFRANLPWRGDHRAEAELLFSSVDDLALWVNGRFHWFLSRGRSAWWDFALNEEHVTHRIPIDLVPGDNEVVIRVRGGVYASGGFYTGMAFPIRD